MNELRGKVAVVTGGVSGIGLAIGKALLQENMKVVLTYRRRSHLEQALAELDPRQMTDVWTLELDVTDRAAVEAAAASVVQRFGSVHLLCNNAGVNLVASMETARHEDWDWILDVNLGGVVNGLVSFLPHLRRHGEPAHILNVGSMASFISGPQSGLYTTSKFAVRGLTECLRYSLAPHGIGVSLLAPGLVATRIHEAACFRPSAYGEQMSPDAAEVKRMAEVHRLGMDPMEVGRRAVEGIRRNDAYIFTHPEFRADLEGVHGEIMAAQPGGEADAGRLAIEERRRQATARARDCAGNLGRI